MATSTHLERKHIAAIAPTLVEAREFARCLGIPQHNAVSSSRSQQGPHRGRSFAGYILAPGCHPNLEFWESFAPCLYTPPHYSAADLRAMLATAEKRESEEAQAYAATAFAPR